MIATIARPERDLVSIFPFQLYSGEPYASSLYVNSVPSV